MDSENISTLLVTGASGFVGSGLCGAAAENGYAVVALSRSPDNAAIPSVQRIEAWQPDAELIPSSTLSNCGAVVHLAGETIGQRWNPDKKARIRESRVNSTNRLVESLSKAETKPEVLVCASAIGFYGESGDWNSRRIPGRAMISSLKSVKIGSRKRKRRKLWESGWSDCG